MLTSPKLFSIHSSMKRSTGSTECEMCRNRVFFFEMLFHFVLT